MNMVATSDPAMEKNISSFIARIIVHEVLKYLLQD